MNEQKQFLSKIKSWSIVQPLIKADVQSAKHTKGHRRSQRADLGLTEAGSTTVGCQSIFTVTAMKNGGASQKDTPLFLDW